MRALPLAPVDGFVLSRVDGVTSVGDLAEAMGLEIEDVLASLLKLESMRLVVPPRRRSSPCARASPNTLGAGARRRRSVYT